MKSPLVPFHEVEAVIDRPAQRILQRIAQPIPAAHVADPNEAATKPFASSARLLAPAPARCWLPGDHSGAFLRSAYA